MTTFYAPHRRLPRAASVAATLQLAVLLLSSCLTTYLALIVVAYSVSPEGRTAAGVAAGIVLAIAVAAPIPAVTIMLVVAMSRARRISSDVLLRFELTTCAVLAGVLAAGAIVSAAHDQVRSYLGLLADVGMPLAVYGVLAAAVAVPIVAATRR